MLFIPLDQESQLNDIVTANNYQVILKHNTTCSISQGVKERLENDNETINGVASIYLLDLLSNRELSNAIAGRFGVPHQSPQVLLIKDGRCVYNEWGFDITAKNLRAAVKEG